ncbi:MAG: phosphate signaling complex protein PhoU [Spirochaetales bacterium]|nr:phosphate signaling complex protein PhoU [Spirochaetales bacterium]
MIRHFEEDLKHLKERVLSMGNVVESMIDKAIQSIIKEDIELKNQVLKWEEEVNKTQIEIDETCIALIALQQPAAVDLRFITSAMKINSDLERMGDQAVNIIDHSLKSIRCMPQAIIDYITKMSEFVQKMVSRSLEAFVTYNVEMAKGVLLLDDDVDSLKEQIFHEIQECIKGDTEKINHSLDLVIISRNLERIGDHATNISEDVIYMILGKDIRHHQQII